MHSPKYIVAFSLSVCLAVGLCGIAVATDSSRTRPQQDSLRIHQIKRSVRSSTSISDSISNINFATDDFKANNGDISISSSISSNTNIRSSKSPFGKFTLTTARIQQCREGCLEKFAIKEELCQQRPECSMCWDECAKPPPPKINKSIRETWALRTISMLQQDSLVLVDVAWSPLNTPNKCLVTWEVSGGGLMGNLLTESSSVQLSLWPDTKYRVQVTCKNKKSGALSRSLPLTIDTIDAIPPQERTQHISVSSPSSSQTNSSSAGQQLPPLTSSSSSSGEDNSRDLLFNHHTNFVFNWHNTDNDVTIDKIESLDHPDIMTIAALSDMQKPLLFGVIAGIILLAVILFLYICLLRTQRTPSDKKALIDDDEQNILTPPTLGTANHFGVEPCQSSIAEQVVYGGSIDPAIYSRTVHVLTV